MAHRLRLPSGSRLAHSRSSPAGSGAGSVSRQFDGRGRLVELLQGIAQRVQFFDNNDITLHQQAATANGQAHHDTTRLASGAGGVADADPDPATDSIIFWQAKTGSEAESSAELPGTP